MTLAAALVLILQDPWADLESPSPEKAYRAIERLASGGPEARAALAEKAAKAEGRLKTHLETALQGPLFPVRRVTLKPVARGATETLQEIARQSGLVLDLKSLADEKLPEVAVEVVDAHPFEALAAVCRAAELWLSWESDRISVHTGGFADAPASRFGPFDLHVARIREERVVEFVRAPRESLVLDVVLNFEHGLPLLGVAGLDVLEARDDRGGDLRNASEAPPAEPEAEEGPVARPHLLQDAEFPAILRPLPAGARSLALLRGLLRVRLPRVSRAVDLAHPAPGSTASARGLSIRVTHVRRNESRLLVDVSFENRALAGRPLLVTGFRADGLRERVHASVVETPADGVAHLAVEVQPRVALRFGQDAPPVLLDRLRVEVVEEVVERAIPFEFRGVPIR